MVDITPTGETQETAVSSALPTINSGNSTSSDEVHWYALGAAEALQRQNVTLEQGLQTQWF
jgi:hypothetical protein